MRMRDSLGYGRVFSVDCRSPTEHSLRDFLSLLGSNFELWTVSSHCVPTVCSDCMFRLYVATVLSTGALMRERKDKFHLHCVVCAS